MAGPEMTALYSGRSKGSRLGKVAEVSLRLRNAKSAFEFGHRFLVHVTERL